MNRLDRYLGREFAQSGFAALVVLGLVSVGGVFTDVLQEIARGKVPAALLLSQLGLRLVLWFPLILPLAVLVGLMLAVGRLYRDSEMPVLAAVGVGPAQLLRPLLLFALPVVLAVALASLWLGPLAQRIANGMVADANRSTVVAGLEPGRFTELVNGGVAYVGDMSRDGRGLMRVFVYRQKGDRLDVITAEGGAFQFGADGQRYLRLDDGFQVEGPVAGPALDYRLLRFAANDVRLPAGKDTLDRDDPELLPTLQLLGDPRAAATAQWNRRLAPPLLTLALALLAVPLSRSAPRQSRYGNLLIGLLVYILAMFLMMLGTDWLASGALPGVLGLWWLVLPLLLVSAWLFARDGRLPRRGARR